MNSTESWSTHKGLQGGGECRKDEGDEAKNYSGQEPDQLG